MIERFFRDITTKMLRRGIYHSVPDLVAAIEVMVAAYDANTSPFVGTTKRPTALLR